MEFDSNRGGVFSSEVAVMVMSSNIGFNSRNILVPFFYHFPEPILKTFCSTGWSARTAKLRGSRVIARGHPTAALLH